LKKLVLVGLSALFLGGCGLAGATDDSSMITVSESNVKTGETAAKPETTESSVVKEEKKETEKKNALDHLLVVEDGVLSREIRSNRIFKISDSDTQYVYIRYFEGGELLTANEVTEESERNEIVYAPTANEEVFLFQNVTDNEYKALKAEILN
jgi:hypothetical protein